MLIDLLRASADRDPDRALVVTDSSVAPVGQVLAQAEGVAAGLAARGIGRIACLVDDVGPLLAIMCGAAAAGVEICICPTYLGAEALDEVLAAIGNPMVVTSVSDLLDDEPGRPPGSADDPGLLILTSGTTGRPKATRHRWSRLVAGVASDPRSTWLLTYNVNQFAGIQILLHVLVNDGTLVVPRSRRPDDVVSAVARHGVTHASGTPTFWRLLLAQAAEAEGLALRQITLGGEVVPGDLLRRLAERFPDARITHIYAGTEFGSAIAVSDGLPGIPVELLERGGGRAQLRVVDGELLVRSTVGMVGYAGDADVPGSEWFATGDLVEEVGDRLIFTGRVNDRINVGGTKVSPHQVEDVVYAVDGVRLAAAYGKPNPITGAIVAVDVVPEPGRDQAGLKQAIREACEQLPAPARPRLVRFVDSLEERAGKTIRGAAGMTESAT
ncbi:MAG TPA: class I adenylate-forming enzyme family protein [Mycobacteriales bacterium]|nr:class I adenylate-forming enzyme family protein [Mycobacteriales bacterium]